MGMFFIAHMYGFVREDVVMNGKHHPKFTADIREALPFTTVEQAQGLMRSNSYNRHFAILTTTGDTNGATPAVDSTPVLHEPAAMGSVEGSS